MQKKKFLLLITSVVWLLLLPVYIPADYCDTAGVTAAGAAPRIRETRCELDPETVASLASIAHDGNIAILERNDLIDRYNAARAALMQLQQLQQKQEKAIP